MTIDAPLANTITLGVGDVGVERRFYRDLGRSQVFEDNDFAVFELRGALLALFPIDKLAQDGHTSPEPRQGGIRFSVIIDVDSPEEVDQLAERVQQAGGTLTKPPTQAESSEGRDAYFADLEGNYWEIAWGHQTTRSSPPPDEPPASSPMRPPAS